MLMKLVYESLVTASSPHRILVIESKIIDHPKSPKGIHKGYAMTDAKIPKVVPIKKRAAQSDGSARKPLVETAYERIQEAVSDGAFKPGQRMLEAEIAVWLDISRTPVREALRRLIDQDTLSYDRYGNLIVTKVDQQMVIEVYHMREVLEGAAARLTARHAYDEEIETLTDLVKLYDDELLSRKEQLKLNSLFHQTIADATHNRYLTRAFDALPHPVQSHTGSSRLAPERLKIVAEEHRDIIQAITNRDPDAAEAAAKKHVNTSRRRWLDQLKDAELKS